MVVDEKKALGENGRGKILNLVEAATTENLPLLTQLGDTGWFAVGDGEYRAADGCGTMGARKESRPGGHRGCAEEGEPPYSISPVQGEVPQFARA